MGFFGFWGNFIFWGRWGWELEMRNQELGLAAAVWVGVFGVGCGVFGVGAGRNARGGVRQTRASNARPYYIIGKVGCVFVWGLPFACRGLHGRPANGAGVYFRGCGCGEGGSVRCRLRGETQEPAFGTPGRSQAPPLRWNCERAIKISRILLRCMVGVELCSTRGALRQHKALAGGASLALTI